MNAKIIENSEKAKFRQIGEYLEKLHNSGTVDGAVIILPFIKNPKPERMVRVDLSKIISYE